MAEQRMKVRDKKVQKMTKDGLVEENLTDKSSVRVSNRASDVQMGIKQGEKAENLVDKSPRQSKRSGKNIRPSVQKSRDAPELMRTENQSEDFGQNRKQQNRKRIRAENRKESRFAEKSEASQSGSKDNTVCQAGGFIIQLMPGASEEIISSLEKKLGEISSVTTMLNQGMTPEDILTLILGDMGLEITDRMDTRFYCNCSKERVEKALISIGKKELQNMIDDGKEVEVNCHFCNKHYVFQVPELEELLKKAQR